jgi:hypothetical protein
MMPLQQKRNQHENPIMVSHAKTMSGASKREKTALSFWQRRRFLCVLFAIFYTPFQLWLVLKSTCGVSNDNIAPCSWQDWRWYESQSKSLSLSPSPADEKWSQRYIEVQEQLKVEIILTQQITKRARERRLRKEYHPSDAKQLKEENDAYFRLVQQTLQPPLPQYRPDATWAYNSFADISILGFPKAGTSHLYRILVTHPDTAPLFKRKEFCVDHGHFLDYTGSKRKRQPPRYQQQQQQQHDQSSPDQVTNTTLSRLQHKLWKYHKHVYKKRQNITEELRRDHGATTTRTLLINACLQPEELDYHAAYTPFPAKAKFIILFRDPADWLWATWNFWFDRALDMPRPRNHDWASPGVHYRSPELFHELILSDETVKPAATRFAGMRQETVHTPRRIQVMVGKDNVLCLKNEDMRPEQIRRSKGGPAVENTLHRQEDASFLDQLARFTGLNQSKFDTTVMSSASNCNSQKGFGKVCNISTSGGSSVGEGGAGQAYEITHHRPMLQATRHLIYLQFHEECKLWALEFGIFYHDCLNAVPK